MLFEDVVSYYVASTTHRSKERDKYSLKRLQPVFAGRRISDIRRADVRSYIAVRRSAGASVGTIDRELTFFSAAINFARIELEQTFANPVANIALQQAEGRVRWITREEAARLIESAGYRARWPHLSAFIRLALFSGCRKSELLGLEWSRVDIPRRVFLLEGHHTKAGRRRAVPLNDPAIQALQDMKDWIDQHVPGSPWVFGRPGEGRITTLQNGFASACKRAGIADFRIHDLRHTFASWLVMQGVSLYVVKDLLGHSSIAVTERYAHLSPDAGRTAVQMLLPV